MPVRLEQLFEFVVSNKPLFVLTGAGCSTDSGIPDYRDDEGDWKFSKPVQFNEFMSSEFVRKRYWARSMLGWSRIKNARPNPAHISLARLESSGVIHHLVTQNVDSLHQKAGSNRVLDLHGNLKDVRCINCQHIFPRTALQDFLITRNVNHTFDYDEAAPDGDAVYNGTDYDDFNIPACENCKGILKPDVVFFFFFFPRGRVTYATNKLYESSGMLIIGSSLMVFSGFRFVREALKRNIPVAAINLGKTRADSSFIYKFQSRCGPLLEQLTNLLA